MLPECSEFPFPAVDFSLYDDPIQSIIQSPAFEGLVRRIRDQAYASLLSPHSLAILYAVVRSQRPEHAVEIGTYKAGTSQLICRALCANATGLLHTIDPYGAAVVPPIIAEWPEALRRHLEFRAISSGQFYGEAVQHKLRADFIFVDGNHEYDFAFFDLQCAARILVPGGLLFVDDVVQPGPYFAIRDFLRANPLWRELGAPTVPYKVGRPFDPGRSAIPGAGFAVLRAPSQYLVGARPVGTGIQLWGPEAMQALVVDVDYSLGGTLHAQCSFRSLGEPLKEQTVERSTEIPVGFVGKMRIEFCWAFDPKDIPRYIDPWLEWDGEPPLVLAGAPVAVPE